MPIHTLACGPYFDEMGIATSLVLLLAGKPLTYAAFVSAFRYRVSSAQPLSFKTGAWIVAIRTIVGTATLGVAFLLLNAGDDRSVLASWVLLLCERVLVWIALGAGIARISDRRLVGWTFAGIGMDLAFDLTAAAAVMLGPVAGVPLAIGLAVLLVPLFFYGRRASLKARFQTGNCSNCLYDLSGNTSGVCPECGTALARTAA